MSQPPSAKKSLGQHWLTDTDSLHAMCQAAEISADDTVLEIGPGLGTLTELLVRRTGRVIAVELDEQLAGELSARVPARSLKIVQQDILQFDFGKLPPGYKVVANIPYYLTSHLIRVLSESANPPMCAALLVQKEVAERVTASPGDMSLLSVLAQYYWEVTLGRVVPAKLFAPPPKVDSQIVVLKRRPAPPFPDADAKQFFRLVKAGFSGRRKTLLNALAAGLAADKPIIAALLQAAKIDPSRRAQTLSLDEWYEAYKALRNILSTVKPARA